MAEEPLTDFEPLLAEVARKPTLLTEEDRLALRQAMQAKFKRQVNELFGSLVDREMKRTTGRTERTGRELADKVARSSEFQAKKRQLIEKCKAIINEGRRKLSEVDGNHLPVIALGTQNRGHSFISSFASEATFFAASMAQSMVIPGLRDVRRAAATLTQKDADSETKLEALKHLIQIPAATLGQTNEFLLVRKNLMDMLTDPVTSACALLLITKMFNAACPTVLTSIYETTLDMLHQFTEDQYYMKHNDTHLKLYRVWQKMLVASPTLWVRFPAQKMRQMVQDTVQFLKQSNEKEPGLANAHAVLSTLDPTADWVRQWAHSAAIRKALVEYGRSAFAKQQLQILFDLDDVPVRRKISRSRIAFRNHSEQELFQVMENYALNVVIQLFMFEDSRTIIVSSSAPHAKTERHVLAMLIEHWLMSESTVLARTTKSGLILLSTKPSCAPQVLAEEVQSTLVECAKRDNSILAGVMKICRQALQNASAKDLKQICEDQQMPSAQLVALIADSFGKHQQQTYPESAEEALLLLQELSTIQPLLDQLKQRNIEFLTNAEVKSSEQKAQLNSLKTALFSNKEAFAKVGGSLALTSAQIDGQVKHMFIYIDLLRNYLNKDAVRTDESKLFWVAEKMTSDQELNFPCLANIPTELARSAWQTNIMHGCLEDSRLVSALKQAAYVDRLPMTMGQLTFLSTNLDTVTFLRDEKLDGTLQMALEACPKGTSANSEEGVIVCSFSTQLVQLMCQQFIAGPSERPTIDAQFTSSFNKELFKTKFEASRMQTRARQAFKSMSGTSRSSTDSLSSIQDYLELLRKERRLNVRSYIVQALDGVRKTSAKCQPQHPQNWRQVIEYAVHTKLAKDDQTAMQMVGTILPQIPSGNNASTLTSSSTPKDDKSAFQCVDWFSSALFLLFIEDHGNLVNILRKLPNIKRADCFWAHHSSTLNAFANAVNSKVWPAVERVLNEQNEFTVIARAFSVARVPLFSLLLMWTNQAYLNVLDWPQVCHYVALAITGGPRIQAAFFCAVLLHLSRPIVLHSQTGQLIRYLASPVELRDFEIRKYADFLARVYSQKNE